MSVAWGRAVAATRAADRVPTGPGSGASADPLPGPEEEPGSTALVPCLMLDLVDTDEMRVWMISARGDDSIIALLSQILGFDIIVQGK